MTEATYTAWDGKLYEWPPPQGWYEASDGRWWPEGYGPRLETEVDSGEGSADESAAEPAPAETSAADGALGESTGFDSTSLTSDAVETSAGVPSYAGSSPASGPPAESGPPAGSSWAPPDTGSSTEFASPHVRSDAAYDTGESAAVAAAAVTGDHKPMTAWVAESSEASIASLGAEPLVEPESRSEDHAGLSDAAAASVGDGLSELAGTTRETGTELFSRLQAEAGARGGDTDERISAESEAETDPGFDAAGATALVSPSETDVLSDAATEMVSPVDSVDFDGEATTEQPAIDTPSRSEFSGRFGSSRPGFTNSAYDEPAYDEPGYDQRSFDEPGYGEPGYGEPGHEPVGADHAGPDDAAVLAEPMGDEMTYADLGHGGYPAEGTVEAQAGDTRSYEPPGFSPDQPYPAYDAPGYDSEAHTDPGFGGDHEGTDYQGGDYQGTDYEGGDYQGGDYQGGDYQGGDYQGGDYEGGDYQGGDYQGGDYQVATEQPGPEPSPVQAASLGYESPRAAVSPMDAPTPSAGLGQRILYTILGVLALAAAGVAGYLAFQLQNDSDDADTTEQTTGQGDAEPVIGSLANPHDPGSGIRVEYPDGDETQPWTLQLQSVESDGADGEVRLAMQIVNDEAQGQGQLADLQLALVDADGNDLASAPSSCAAGDTLDLAATLGAAQGVSGPVCWSVGGVLPDDALLAVQSTKAQGRIYISLP